MTSQIPDEGSAFPEDLRLLSEDELKAIWLQALESLDQEQILPLFRFFMEEKKLSTLQLEASVRDFFQQVPPSLAKISESDELPISAMEDHVLYLLQMAEEECERSSTALIGPEMIKSLTLERLKWRQFFEELEAQQAVQRAYSRFEHFLARFPKEQAPVINELRAWPQEDAERIYHSIFLLMMDRISSFSVHSIKHLLAQLGSLLPPAYRKNTGLNHFLLNLVSALRQGVGESLGPSSEKGLQVLVYGRIWLFQQLERYLKASEHLDFPETCRRHAREVFLRAEAEADFSDFSDKELEDALFLYLHAQATWDKNALFRQEMMERCWKEVGLLLHLEGLSCLRGSSEELPASFDVRLSSELQKDLLLKKFAELFRKRYPRIPMEVSIRPYGTLSYEQAEPLRYVLESTIKNPFLSRRFPADVDELLEND